MTTHHKLAIVVPSLRMGGLERVASEIANFVVCKKNCKVTLIMMVASPIFYELDPRIRIISPQFTSKNKAFQFIDTIKFLRKIFIIFKPDAVLSFGSKFNSLTLIAGTGLNLRIFVSDRSNPYRNSSFNFFKRQNPHDGIIHPFLKWFFYRRATGIIAQTNLAKQIDSKFLNHKNIEVIGNPVKKISGPPQKKENIILNVGRFADKKNQLFLIEAFKTINNPQWKIWFAGDGPLMAEAVKKVKHYGIEKQVEFLGKVKNVDLLYAKSKIFAFTSLSEGFPNALAEALTTPVASIAFDCTAGPADLIQNGINGFLVKVNEEHKYIHNLEILMNDPELRTKFEVSSVQSMKQFDINSIGDKYYKFLLDE